MVLGQKPLLKTNAPRLVFLSQKRDKDIITDIKDEVKHEIHSNNR
jgi:hypothetical protein